MTNTEYLQHAEGTSALLGTQRQNVNYYKREGEPGNYRYFYTKEEYDAAHKNNESPQESDTKNINNVDNSNRRNKSAKTQAQKVNQKQPKYSNMQLANKINNAKINNTYDKKFVDTIKGMDKMSPEDRVSEYKNYLKDPDNYTEQTFITDRLTKLGDGGNVNLNLRPEISTKELIDAGWKKKDVGDGYATVYSSTYSNEDEDTFYNFTPIIMDPKTGEYMGCMGPKEFKQYCCDVIDGLRDDDLNCQIGGPFDGENALQNAENAAIEIHELHEKMHK
jgi:hypothetical protein